MPGERWNICAARSPYEKLYRKDRGGREGRQKSLTAKTAEAAKETITRSTPRTNAKTTLRVVSGWYVSPDEQSRVCLGIPLPLPLLSDRISKSQRKLPRQFQFLQFSPIEEGDSYRVLDFGDCIRPFQKLLKKRKNIGGRS